MYELLCEYITFIEEFEIPPEAMAAADNAFDMARLKYRDKITAYINKKREKDKKTKQSKQKE